MRMTQNKIKIQFCDKTVIKHKTMIQLKEILYHILMICIFAGYLMTGLYRYSQESPPEETVEHGIILTCLTYFTEAFIFISFPYILFNCLGLLLLNPFTTPKRQPIGLDVPFICFRVVTKGTYPKLVKEITQQNVELCRKIGLKSFKFEIVTDNPINVRYDRDIFETIVPDSYRTRNRSMHKARALQYCLEPNVNTLLNADYLVHLDEETKLTDDVIYGILDFMKSSADVGQGTIVYAAEDVENWLTTLLDGLRVAFDYGMMRLCFQVFKRPALGFKGSFIVSKVATELDVNYDFGPKESIAEDLRFALTAWSKGYKFDFVHGVMLEKSTFGILDYIKQRKRWFVGHFHILWGSSLPLYCKAFLLPINILNLFLFASIMVKFVGLIWPITMHIQTLLLMNITVSCITFLLPFGNFMSFHRQRWPFIKKIMICFLSQFLLPVMSVLEATATLWGFLTRNNLSFHIVKKEVVNQNIEIV